MLLNYYLKLENLTNGTRGHKYHINSFSTHVPLLYPLKTSENREVENGLKMGCWKWVNYKQSKENGLPLVFNAFMYNHFHKMLYQSTVLDNA